MTFSMIPFLWGGGDQVVIALWQGIQDILLAGTLEVGLVTFF